MSGAARREGEPAKATSKDVSGGPVVSTSPLEGIIQEISRITQTKEQAQPMPNENFDADLIVIGAGPGGYVAAIRAAQLGAKTICVEKEFLGGTCLNWGCIPSKAMIASVERLEETKHATDLGVTLGGELGYDFEKIMARKDKIVQTQRGGVGYLFKKNKVEHVEGFAKFIDAHTIEVDKDGQKKKLTAKNFILAMGSSVMHIPIPGLEGGRAEGVWTSDEAVTADHVPNRMLILGGGAVGCEFSYVFNGLGSEVTLVEMMPTLIPMFDEELGKELGKQMTRSGVKLKTGASLDKCERKGKEWHCTVTSGGKSEVIVVDVVLLGVGRKANTDGMNLEQIGVKLHRRGVEIVDDTLQTHVPNIYAIGDVTGRIQLAHVASHEGIVAVHNIVEGKKEKASYKAVPNCVYTVPEVASVGLTEDQAKTQGYEVKVGKAGFRSNGKAMASGHQEGFVKVVIDAKYGEVLGMHLIGSHVTDMVHEGVAALNLEATLESMIMSIHAHPTMAEVVLEAFEDAHGLAIHKA
ncbi:dihydrolipoyl dehydrogenase [Kamptonema cortianum]|nr:dihydrolipoyl dehydrogenase [Geitlerinema splendidum]MDK3160353.1 dihydrolipoyl dehydrogenase [Kamptonema cortianum]